MRTTCPINPQIFNAFWGYPLRRSDAINLPSRVCWPDRDMPMVLCTLKVIKEQAASSKRLQIVQELTVLARLLSARRSSEEKLREVQCRTVKRPSFGSRLGVRLHHRVFPPSVTTLNNAMELFFTLPMLRRLKNELISGLCPSRLSFMSPPFRRQF